jgi:asparagine synthetase B (glutamine-hydrolysing)
MGAPPARENDMKTAMGYREIATHARHVICPRSLIGSDHRDDIAAIGERDFARYPYRHLGSRYRADSVYSEELLIDGIKRALQPLLGGERKPLLLLSDGKDSMSLAVGLAELGVRCTTLTLLRREDSTLREYVEATARRLGHAPHFVTSEQALAAFDPQVFLEACSKMDGPVLDQGFIFFLFGMKVFFERNSLDPRDYVVLDGLGNDEYFGYLPSKDQLRAYRLARYGLWRGVPDSMPWLSWYLRSPAEAQGDLSALACFFPIRDTHNLNLYFALVPHSLEPCAFVDFRAFSRGSFHDHQCMMGKTRAAAMYLGTIAVFPWLNSELADWCFNLPVAQKFDFAKVTNKLPLRNMLARRVAWSQTKRGVDLYYDLDNTSFPRTMAAVVSSRPIERIARGGIFGTSVRSRAYLELLNLFGYCLGIGMTGREIEEMLGS